MSGRESMGRRLSPLEIGRALRLLAAYAWTEIRYRPRLGSMGRRCLLQLHRLVGAKHIHLGNRVTIYWGARLEAISRYAGKEYSPRIEIGDGVGIGQNLHCTSSQSISIGANTAITANVTITDTHHSYEDLAIPIKDSPLISKPVTIGPDSIVLNNAVILPGTRIGRHSVVGANSVVKGEFEDFCVLVGSPARVVRRLDPESGEWTRVRGEAMDLAARANPQPEREDHHGGTEC